MTTTSSPGAASSQAPLHTAEALATGAGRNGRTRSSDGRVDLALATPVEMGGSGDGSNPEQLFAAGYAACYHSALQRVLRTQRVSAEGSSVGARVSLVRVASDADAEALGTARYGLAVALEVALPGVEHDRALQLAHAADLVCPYSNALRGNVVVDISVVDD